MSEEQPERLSEADLRYYLAAVARIQGAQACLKMVSEVITQTYGLGRHDLLHEDGTIERAAPRPELLPSP